MTSFQKLAAGYADEIRDAIGEDKRFMTKSASLLESREVVATRVAKKLEDVGRRIKGITYTETGEHLSQEHEDELTAEIAERLGIPQVREFRRVLKEASISNQLVVVSDIRAMINSVKTK